ncbi:MAG: aspartate/glutamate racemase family protein [Burkholderiales bacterium]|nr:aspartate/glutamate racemase family protein [Burkholderiales bacterium]
MSVTVMSSPSDPPLLGVLGGMGPLAAADFLAKLAEETPATRDQEHIPYVAWGVPQIPDRPAAILGGGASPLPQMLRGIAALKQAGAQAIAIACNTAHYWHDDLLREGGLPILHIADAACDLLAERGITAGSVGLIGTEGTLQAGFFQQRLAARGLGCIIGSAEDRQRLMLPAIAAVKANDLPLAHTLAVQAVLRLHEAGARAVVLACTETPLAIDHAPSAAAPLCIDATRALARACVAWHRRASKARGGA